MIWTVSYSRCDRFMIRVTVSVWIWILIQLGLCYCFEISNLCTSWDWFFIHSRHLLHTWRSVLYSLLFIWDIIWVLWNLWSILSYWNIFIGYCTEIKGYCIRYYNRRTCFFFQICKLKIFINYNFFRDKNMFVLVKYTLFIGIKIVSNKNNRFRNRF